MIFIKGVVNLILPGDVITSQVPIVAFLAYENYQFQQIK